VPLWLIGGQEAHTYDNGSATDFITGLNIPTQNYPLNSAYGVVTSILPSVNPAFGDPALQQFLGSRLPSIAGNSNGVATGSPITRGPLELSESDMFEIGYKGIIAGKLSVSLDLYYNRRQNNLTAPVPTAPLLLYPSLGDDLGAAVAAAFTDAELAQFGLDVVTLAGTYQAVAAGIATPGGTPTPLAVLNNDQILSSTQASGFGGGLGLAYLNIKELDYFGIDFGLEYYITKDISVFGNLSWVSDAYWENLEISGSETGTEFSLNIPDTQLKFGFDYTPDNGFYGNIAVRYNNSWRSVNGTPWTGDVDAYTIVDAGAGYKFDFGLNLGVTATNLFDTDY
ncbi:MAG: TonB-dependent receptor, partial [Bacteroidota bacterium]